MENHIYMNYAVTPEREKIDEFTVWGDGRAVKW